MIRITDGRSAVQAEQLRHPFGFKGASLTELWQIVAQLRSDSGLGASGLGVQSVLWSDAELFAADGERVGNEKMYALTQHALQLAVQEKMSYAEPFELMEQLVERVYRYGCEQWGHDALRPTFALNAMVAVDHAAWMLYARENQLASFEAMLPEDYRMALTTRHQELATVPLISYGMTMDEVKALLDDGYFLLKVKLGADPEQDGDPEKMLKWDQQRLADIHRIAEDYETEYTEYGGVVYYLDANGRYPGKDYLQRFIDYADQIGALSSILLFEEPFAEDNKIDVNDLPIRIVADESVHSLADAQERMELGYRAMALKPIAKTMSLSLQVAKLAEAKGVPCFCADLTVNPLMVEWNKNLAACLRPIPGLHVGVLETNGSQNYAGWERMTAYHPQSNASWVRAARGLFHLDDTFYATGGGIFDAYACYEALLTGQEK